MGGTLDIRTFYYPLRHLEPCTFNIAIDLRTTVRLLFHNRNTVKITSRGFEAAEFDIDSAPFRHPMGLMFAIAAYFRTSGVHIDIDSASPPKSALGGSSSAAVALVAAFSMAIELLDKHRNIDISEDFRKNTALLAHGIEESVAGVPCGLQDQLAAVYGGVNAWYWPKRPEEQPFKQERLPDDAADELHSNILVAYCGIPHESVNINRRWVDGFLQGKNRKHWERIIECTHQFIAALKRRDFRGMIKSMVDETETRLELTPDVLDETGKTLFSSAVNSGCGARFTGAGGGGCIWAIGESDNIDNLKKVWENQLYNHEHARILDGNINLDGLKILGQERRIGKKKLSR